MKTQNNEFIDQVKGVLKRIPGIHGLNKARYEIVQIRELSNLIKENRIAVLHPCSRLVNDDALNYEIVHEVVKDFLDVYGIVRLRRTTAAAMDVPEGAVLLHAPLALLKIPYSHDEYLAQVGTKTRNMIR